MKTSELIEEIAERIGVTTVIVKKMMDAEAAIITEQLQKGESVALHVTLGAFKAEGKPQRRGKNPKTGEDLIIKARIKPFFRISESLKKALN